MTNISKYDLISSVISLINSEEYESTISNMATSLKVPVQYIRRTVLSLLNNQILQSCINAREDFENDDDDLTFIESFFDAQDEVTNDIIDGIYDDTIWEINLKILDNNEQEILPLTHIELGVLKAMGENVLSLKHGAIFEKKETINPISPTINKLRDIIQDAIYNKKAISFNYMKYNQETKQSESQPVVCFPQEIITNVSDNWLYMQSTELKLYRLDRMIHPVRTTNNAGKFPGVTVNPNQKYVWGAFSKLDDVPTHVKLRIAPETKNIVTKIKSDTALRTETNKFYQDGNFYYYEDDIIGLDEFQRWVRSYGSSIVVIEPESLRNKILERAKQTLDLYEASKNWGSL